MTRELRESGHPAGLGEKPQLAYQHFQAPPGLPASAEYTVGDVLRFLWASRLHVMAGALLALVVIGGLLIAKRLLLPDVNGYSSAIVITMAEAQSGTYPNGAPFSPNDLRSPMVLGEVYIANKLDEYGISLSDFSGMIAVEAYSPSYEGITERYRARLDNKALTFEERKVIEDEFRVAIASTSANGLKVTFAPSEAWGVSDAVGKKVAADIPAKWAEVFINRLGAANLPVVVSGAELVDTKLAAELDYPLAYDYLSRQSAILATQLQALQALPSSRSYLSPQNGKSLADLQRQADSFEEFRLRLYLKPIVDEGLSKERELTALVYENLISSLNFEAQSASETAKGVRGVFESFRDQPVSAASGPTSAPGSITTQFDGAFVDRILELTTRKDALAFEQSLLRDRLDIENRGVAIADRKARMSERLNALKLPPLDPSIRSTLEKRFVEGMAVAINELNGLWKEASQLSSDLGASKLNYDKALYQPAVLSEEAAVAKAPLADLRSLLMLALSLFAGAGLGFFVFWARKQIAQV